MASNTMHPPVDPMPSVSQSSESIELAKPETNNGPTNPLTGCTFDLLLSIDHPASCELGTPGKPINDQSLYLTENYTADLLHLESDLHNGFELATTIRKLKIRRPVVEKFYSKPFLKTARVEERPQVCRNTQRLKILVVDYKREAIRKEERQRAALASIKLRKFEERKHAGADKQAGPDAFESNTLDSFLKASAEKNSSLQERNPLSIKQAPLRLPGTKPDFSLMAKALQRLKKKMVMKSDSTPVSNMENTPISRTPIQNKKTLSSKPIEQDGGRVATDPGRVETAKDEPTVATVQIFTPAVLQPELVHNPEPADHPSATAIQSSKVQPEAQVSNEVTPEKELEPVVDCKLEVEKVLENEAQVADCFPNPSHVTLTIELEAALAAQSAADSDEPVNPIAEEKYADDKSLDMVIDIESSTDEDMPVISNVKSNRAADNSTQNTTPSLRLTLQELMSPSSTSNSLSQAFRTMKDLEQRITALKSPVTEQLDFYIQEDVGTSNSSLKTAVSCPNYQLDYCVDDSQLVYDKRDSCPEPDDCELTIKSVMSMTVTTDADVIVAQKNLKHRKPSQTRKRCSFSILTPGSPSKQKQYQSFIDEPVGEEPFRDGPIREKILEETSNQSAEFSDSSGLGLKISKPCSVVLDKSCSVINLLAENTNVQKLPKEVDEEVLKQRARVFLPHINLFSLRLLSWLYERPEGQRHCNYLDYLDASDFLCCYNEFALACSIHPTGSKPDVVLSNGLKYIVMLQRRVICLLVEVTSHIIKSKRLHRRKALLEQKLKGNEKRLSGPRDEWTNALNQQESLNGKIFLTSLRSFVKFENLSPQENYIRARNTELRRDINHDLKLIEFHMDPTVEAELELKWNQAVRTKLVNAVMFTSPNRKPATFCQQELDQISMDDEILQDCILRNQKYSESLFKQREESGRNSSQISALSQEFPSGSCSEKGFTPLKKQLNTSKKSLSDQNRALDAFLAQVYNAIFLNNSRSMNKVCPTLQSSIPTVRTRTMTRAYNAMYMQFLRQSVKNVRVGGNAHIHIRDGKVVPDEDTSVRGILTKAQGLISNLKRVARKQDDEFRQQMNRNAQLKTKLANLYAMVCRNGKAENPTALKAFSLLGECSTTISEYSFSREWLDRDETPDDMKRMLVELDQIAIPDDMLADFECCTEQLSVSKPSLNGHPQNKLLETVGNSATQNQNLLTKIIDMRSQKTQKSTNVTKLCSGVGSCSEPSQPRCTDTPSATYSQPKDIAAVVTVCSQLTSTANVNVLTNDEPGHDDSDAEVELFIDETPTADKNVTNIVSVSGPYRSLEDHCYSLPPVAHSVYNLGISASLKSQKSTIQICKFPPSRSTSTDATTLNDFKLKTQTEKAAHTNLLDLQRFTFKDDCDLSGKGWPQLAGPDASSEIIIQSLCTELVNNCSTKDLVDSHDVVSETVSANKSAEVCADAETYQHIQAIRPSFRYTTTRPETFIVEDFAKEASVALERDENMKLLIQNRTSPAQTNAYALAANQELSAENKSVFSDTYAVHKPNVAKMWPANAVVVVPVKVLDSGRSSKHVLVENSLVKMWMPKSQNSASLLGSKPIMRISEPSKDRQLNLPLHAVPFIRNESEITQTVAPPPPLVSIDICPTAEHQYILPKREVRVTHLEPKVNVPLTGPKQLTAIHGNLFWHKHYYYRPPYVLVKLFNEPGKSPWIILSTDVIGVPASMVADLGLLVDCDGITISSEPRGSQYADRFLMKLRTANNFTEGRIDCLLYPSRSGCTGSDLRSILSEDFFERFVNILISVLGKEMKHGDYCYMVIQIALDERVQESPPYVEVCQSRLSWSNDGNLLTKRINEICNPTLNMAKALMLTPYVEETRCVCAFCYHPIEDTMTDLLYRIEQGQTNYTPKSLDDLWDDTLSEDQAEFDKMLDDALDEMDMELTKSQMNQLNGVQQLRQSIVQKRVLDELPVFKITTIASHRAPKDGATRSKPSHRHPYSTHKLTPASTKCLSHMPQSIDTTENVTNKGTVHAAPDDSRYLTKLYNYLLQVDDREESKSENSLIYLNTRQARQRYAELKFLGSQVKSQGVLHKKSGSRPASITRIIPSTDQSSPRQQTSQNCQFPSASNDEPVRLNIDLTKFLMLSPYVEDGRCVCAFCYDPVENTVTDLLNRVERGEADYIPKSLDHLYDEYSQFITDKKDEPSENASSPRPVKKTIPERRHPKSDLMKIIMDEILCRMENAELQMSHAEAHSKALEVYTFLENYKEEVTLSQTQNSTRFRRRYDRLKLSSPCSPISGTIIEKKRRSRRAAGPWSRTEKPTSWPQTLPLLAPATVPACLPPQQGIMTWTRREPRKRIAPDTTPNIVPEKILSEVKSVMEKMIQTVCEYVRVLQVECGDYPISPTSVVQIHNEESSYAEDNTISAEVTEDYIQALVNSVDNSNSFAEVPPKLKPTDDNAEEQVLISIGGVNEDNLSEIPVFSSISMPGYESFDIDKPSGPAIGDDVTVETEQPSPPKVVVETVSSVYSSIPRAFQLDQDDILNPPALSSTPTDTPPRETQANITLTHTKPEPRQTETSNTGSARQRRSRKKKYNTDFCDWDCLDITEYR